MNRIVIQILLDFIHSILSHPILSYLLFLYSQNIFYSSSHKLYGTSTMIFFSFHAHTQFLSLKFNIIEDK